jgi:hypothetical protein
MQLTLEARIAGPFSAVISVTPGTISGRSYSGLSADIAFFHIDTWYPSGAFFFTERHRLGIPIIRSVVEVAPIRQQSRARRSEAKHRVLDD